MGKPPSANPGLGLSQFRIVIPAGVRRYAISIEISPDVRDEAPFSGSITAYDRRHVVTYLHILFAVDEEANWDEVVRRVLATDPIRDRERALYCWMSHLFRAYWLLKMGCWELVDAAAALHPPKPALLH